MRLRVTTNAKLVRQGLENLRAEIPKVGRHRLYTAVFKIQSRLKKPGKKIKYPVQWDSERQRQKVMALLREKNNLPYRRTGKYQKGYRIRALPDGYELSNPVKYSKYLGGSARGGNQSRIHAGRYPLVRDEVAKEVAKLPKAVIQHIKTVARQKGFNAR